MTPDERALLERTASLVEENNKMLLSIRRSARATMIMRGLYWVVILLFTFGAYYFIQPYLESLFSMTGSSGGLEGIENSIQNAHGAADSLRDLLK